MNGNSIIGLPNPIDRDAAANKNYVDNGGAITKLPNGAFTAVSDIDFDGFSLKNIPDPIDGKDATNKAYVDDQTIQLAAPIKPIITVWAEEKGPLGDSHYEFSFGNGSSGNEHAYGGYCMSASGRIIRGSLTATQTRIILSEEIKVNNKVPKSTTSPVVLTTTSVKIGTRALSKLFKKSDKLAYLSLENLKLVSSDDTKRLIYPPHGIKHPLKISCFL